MQAGIPEGAEPADAPAEAQGAVEAAEEGSGGEEEGVRVPGGGVCAPPPIPRPGGPGGDQEAFQEETQQPQGMALPQMLQGLRRALRLQSSSQNLWHQRPLLRLWPRFL